MKFTTKEWIQKQLESFANRIASVFAKKTDIPTKTSQLTNDSGFKTTDAIIGVKGNAESSYRTGSVNLTASDIGAVATSKVLTTAAQIRVNTDPENVAGATALRDIINQLGNVITTPDDAPSEFSELFDGGACDIVDITFKKRGKNHTAPYNWTTTDDISSTSSQKVFLSTVNDHKIFSDGIGLISSYLDLVVDFEDEEVTISESADFDTYDYIAVLNLTGFFSEYTTYIPVVFWVSGVENNTPTLYSDILEPDFNVNYVSFYDNVFKISAPLAVALAARR